MFNYHSHNSMKKLDTISDPGSQVMSLSPSAKVIGEREREKTPFLAYSDLGGNSLLLNDTQGFQLLFGSKMSLKSLSKDRSVKKTKISLQQLESLN